MLGVMGTHRCGKSTLAMAFSEKSGLPYVPVNASAVFESLGLVPSSPMSFGDRLKAQSMILNAAEIEWSKHPMGFVTDRTPLDMLAYTLTDVGMNTIENEQQEAELLAYSDACMEATKQHFQLLFMIQPGIPVVYAENKGAMSPGYIMHLNWVMRGLLADRRTRVIGHLLDKSVTDFDRRLKILSDVYLQYCANQSQAAKSFSAVMH